MTAVAALAPTGPDARRSVGPWLTCSSARTSTRRPTSATAPRSSLPTSDFTTHGVIVGMTGSGKTGLGVVLIEEVLRPGVPCLLIDPKGDLTNLCLTFPDLAPADFRPVDQRGRRPEGRRRRPDDFAAQQATTWTEGLAGWGIGGADIGALRRHGRLHDLHARLHRGRAAEHRRLAAGAGRHERRRDRAATRSRATCRACSGWSASRPTRCRRASTSCSSTSSRRRGSRAQSLDLPHARRPGPAARRCASSACSTSTRSSRPRTAWRWP